MKLFIQIVRHQRARVVAVVAALLVLVLYAIPSSRAASVVISQPFMTDQPGTHQLPEITMSTGLQNVYFDYTVESPSSDSCEVDVYAEGTSGIPIATGTLAC